MHAPRKSVAYVISTINSPVLVHIVFIDKAELYIDKNDK